MTSLPYSDFENTKVLVPESYSNSLGGNTYLYESKAGSKKRSKKRKKTRQSYKRRSNKTKMNRKRRLN